MSKITYARIRQAGKRWAIDFSASFLFSAVMDYLTAWVAHIPYYPTIFIFTLTNGFVFRTWTGRLYGVFMNKWRTWLGEGNQ